jgi:nonsense-mediated mRNA decay protein 3
MRRFCYRCGTLESDAGPLIQGLCQRCFSETPLLLAPGEIEVKVCKRCGAYRLGGHWHRQASRGLVDSAVRATVLGSIRLLRYGKSGIRTMRPAEAKDVVVDVKPAVKESLVTVTAVGKVHPLQAKPKEEEKTMKLSLTYATCEICGLKRAGHHEAILQLRGVPSERTLSEMSEALERLAQNAGRAGPKDFIADIKELRGGLDIYVSSVSLAKKMSALLKSKFGASTSESAKLVGQTRDGRKKYRVSILVRFRQVNFKREE